MIIRDLDPEGEPTPEADPEPFCPGLSSEQNQSYT